jgi:CitMHS family citrate-Mg2+:H+ or citrate-Ca2+:H+ symporter
LLVNFPEARAQRERLEAHGHAAMVMVTTVLAAGLFAGIMTGTGMLTSMARDIVGILPTGVLRHLPALLAVVSMPLSLAFDPDSFYFGVLPVLATASHGAGGSAIDVALRPHRTDDHRVPGQSPDPACSARRPCSVDLADHQRRSIPALRHQPRHGGRRCSRARFTGREGVVRHVDPDLDRAITSQRRAR